MCNTHEQLLTVLEDMLALEVLEDAILDPSQMERCASCRVHTTRL